MGRILRATLIMTWILVGFPDALAPPLSGHGLMVRHFRGQGTVPPPAAIQAEKKTEF